MGVHDLGTEYYHVHHMDGTPSKLFFRVIRTATTLSYERFDLQTKAWVTDATMIDYYLGFEPGAEDMDVAAVRAVGIPID